MNENILYEERVTSVWTRGLFVALTFGFSLLAGWRVEAGSPVLGYVFLFFAAVFLFYTVNYGTLIIKVTDDVLHLRFGLFRWTIPVDNIAEVAVDDDIPPFVKYGGAGIHWYNAHGRYRASWNMLEHDRVVVRFKDKVWRAVEVSFSTCHADTVVDVLRGVVGTQD